MHAAPAADVRGERAADLETVNRYHADRGGGYRHVPCDLDPPGGHQPGPQFRSWLTESGVRRD